MVNCCKLLRIGSLVLAAVHIGQVTMFCKFPIHQLFSVLQPFIFIWMDSYRSEPSEWAILCISGPGQHSFTKEAESVWLSTGNRIDLKWSQMFSFLLKNVQSSFIGNSQKLETTQYPSWGAWINKLWYIHAVEYCCCCSIPKVLLTLCDPWTAACQAPLSMKFSRQEYWSGSPFPTPGDLPDPGLFPHLLRSCIGWQNFFTIGATWEVEYYSDKKARTIGTYFYRYRQDGWFSKTCEVKEVSMKRLLTLWFHLCDILEREKL